MSLEWPHPKDPESDLAYTVDWSDALASGENVASSIWVTPLDLSSSTDGYSDKNTGIQLAGGVDGDDYTLGNKIVTTLGNTFQRDIVLKVRNK